MAQQRRSFSADFKARVALEALLREQKAVNELAREFGVHPSLIREWKQLLLDTLPQAFSRHKSAEEKKAITFRMFYILIFCACLGLVGTKLVASIWMPEWDPLFYIISGVLGVIGIGKLTLKAIRLKIAEFRLRKKIDRSPSAPLPGKEASYFRTDCPPGCPVRNTLRLTRRRSMVCTGIPSLAVSNTSIQGVCVSATPNAKAIQRCPSPEFLATKGERLVRL